MRCSSIVLLLLTGATHLASSITTPHDQIPLDQTLLRENALLQANEVSIAVFTELEELARIVDISYCVGWTGLGIGKPFSCLSRCADFPDFELIKTWNTGPLLSDSSGYIALDHAKRRVIVAFRGTYSIANTVVDLSTIPQAYVPYPGDEDDGDGDDSRQGEGQPKCENCTVHMGFNRAWRHTRSAILPDLEAQIPLYPDYRLNLVGHSLGGAVAALAGLDFQARGWNPLVTTFGEPRIGNTGLARYLDERFDLLSKRRQDGEGYQYRRLTHVDDPVPLLPLTEWGYAMHAGEIHITKPSLSPDIPDLRVCTGDNDPLCIAGQDSTIKPENEKFESQQQQQQQQQREKRDLLASVRDEIIDVVVEPWGIPARYKLWQLFFAHRDYFWRLGLCVPGGDPLGGGGGGKYEHLGSLKENL